MRHAIFPIQPARIISAIVHVILVDVGPMPSRQLVYGALNYSGRAHVS